MGGRVRGPVVGAAATAAVGLTAATAVGVTAVLASRVGGRRLLARTERRSNAIGERPPYRVSDAARALHESLLVADLHADTLLWGRDLLVRGDRGCVDVPRLIEGGVALQAFAACVKVPRRQNLDRNADTSDDVTLVAIAGGWPRRTWRSPRARALHLADRARHMAAASGGRLTMVTSSAALQAYLERRRSDRAITAGLLTIEGAAPLEGDPAGLDELADAGFRMLGLAHFVDNAFAGSAHGVAKGGLTDRGATCCVARRSAAC